MLLCRGWRLISDLESGHKLWYCVLNGVHDSSEGLGRATEVMLQELRGYAPFHSMVHVGVCTPGGPGRYPGAGLRASSAPCSDGRPGLRSHGCPGKGSSGHGTIPVKRSFLEERISEGGSWGVYLLALPCTLEIGDSKNGEHESVAREVGGLTLAGCGLAQLCWDLATVPITTGTRKAGEGSRSV